MWQILTLENWNFDKKLTVFLKKIALFKIKMNKFTKNDAWN